MNIEENLKTDSLSKLVKNVAELDSLVYFEEIEKPIIENDEVMEVDDQPNWMTHFILYLKKGELPRKCCRVLPRRKTTLLKDIL